MQVKTSLLPPQWLSSSSDWILLWLLTPSTCFGKVGMGHVYHHVASPLLTTFCKNQGRASPQSILNKHELREGGDVSGCCLCVLFPSKGKFQIARDAVTTWWVKKGGILGF